ASGGDGNISYSWQSSANGTFSDAIDIESNTASYNPGLLTTTTSYRRLAKDASCNTTLTPSSGTWTVTVRPQFTAGAISTTGETICYYSTPSEIGSEAIASGGDGSIRYSWRSSDDSYTTAIIGAEAATYSPGNLTHTTSFRRYAKDASCNTAPVQSIGTWTVFVYDLMITGSLEKHPDVMAVCEGTEVSATLISGQGGNSEDQTEYRTNGGDWQTYISGTSIPTTGKTSVEIRTRRISQFCLSTPYYTVMWTVEPAPIAGTLNPQPSQEVVCETATVAADLVPGTGGNGLDALQYRTISPVATTTWLTYQSGTAINLDRLTAVEIRTQRMSNTCDPSAYNTVSWQVEPLAMNGSILPAPNQPIVCEGTALSAQFVAGSGGNGTELFTYRTKTNDWSEYMSYQAGQVISTHGLTAVEVVTHRLASACQLPELVTYTWMVENALEVTAGPDVTICANSTFALAASNVSEAAAYLWNTTGDGYFDEPTMLHPVYYPGVNDLSGNGVMLTLTASSGIYCNYSDQMMLTFNPMVTAIVEISANTNNVCAGSPVTYTAIATNPGSTPTYTWKVNGLISGTNATNFTYVPQAGDQVWVELASSMPCVPESPVISNSVTVEVTMPQLATLASPANAGTVTGSGSYTIGTVVTLSATATAGWEFLNWTTQTGIPVSSLSAFDYTVTQCQTALRANFVSIASIAGQLKFFNEDETVVQSPYVNGVFYVQLYDGSEPASVPQMVSYSQQTNLDGYFEFNALVPGKDYTMRVWESTISNAITNTWTWNNWGGVTAFDALIINFMSINSNVVAPFPWIGPAPYTATFGKVADVNNSATLTSLDALVVNYRVVEYAGASPYPDNRHNFIFAGHHISSLSQACYPQEPEVAFVMSGTYNAATPADEVYHEAQFENVQLGANYFNIFLIPAGDLNSSFQPYSSSKSAPVLTYQGELVAKAGEMVDIPFQIDQDMDLGAVTVGLNYDPMLIEPLAIEGIEIYTIDQANATIKLAWSNVEGKSYQQGDGLFILKARVVGQMNGTERFAELESPTEFVNAQAQEAENVQLMTKSITTSITGIAEGTLVVTHQCQPNPFVQSAFIQYTLPIEGKVILEIYNQFGQVVYTLVDEHQIAGLHRKQLFDADLNGAGMYIYRIRLESTSGISDVRGNIIMTR
ncbi:MAG: hypothetical protein FD155_2727, partial [Bacteroidetes bacterium]